MAASDFAGAADVFAAHNNNASRSEVIVAIVDSGLRLEHEEFQTLPGYDFISNTLVANDGDGRDSDPSDPGDWIEAADHSHASLSKCRKIASRWHGTAIAGLIGAQTENHTGISGAARQVAILPVRVTGKCGGYARDLIDGIRWSAGLPVPGAPANQTPARIINLSVGYPGACSSDLQRAIDAAANTGAIVVTAATNSGVDLNKDPFSPASCNNVLTIGAALRDGTTAAYSAQGNNVFLLGPGGSNTDGIISTDNEGTRTPELNSSYGFHYGTSLAAAHVSAALASLLSVDSELTNDQLRFLLKQSATPSADISCTEQTCGAGLLNTNRAVKSLLDGESPLPLPDPPANDMPNTAAATPATQFTGSFAIHGLFVCLLLWLLQSGRCRRSGKVSVPMMKWRG